MKTKELEQPIKNKENFQKGLEQLIKNKKDAQKKLEDAHLAISKYKTKHLISDIEKRYKGKYFKFPNSYGDPEDIWTVYAYVKDIKSHNEFDSLTFEIDIYGQITIDTQKNIDENECKVEITEKEFMEEYEKIINLSKNILNKKNYENNKN